MNLTSRQKAFLDRILDLYRERRQSIHYSVIAEKLGVARTTAYEMLKLLEKKGYVASEYVLAEGSGPGRSSVVFYPTAKAREFFRWLMGETAEREEWEQVKEGILSKLGKGERKEKQLLDEMLSKIPTSGFPLVYCAEVMTALLLNLRKEIRSKLGEHDLVKSIMALDSPYQHSLSLLPGFALGLSFTEKANRHLDKLVEYSRECQRRLQSLDDERRRLLADFLGRVVVAFQS